MQNAAAATDAPSAPPTQYIPVKDWSKRHPYPSEGAIRWLLFTDKDGFRTECAVAVGRRILLDESATLRWLGRRRA